MTAPELVVALEARGIRLAVVGDRLRVDAPAGAVTTADRETLLQHKPALLAVLRTKRSPATTADDSRADGVPDGPCGLCGHQPLAEVQDWPMAGECRWLCLRCLAQPVLTLADVHARLTDPERRQLRTEADDGDPLAQLLLGLPAEGTA
jgi:hypothetical protein